MLGRVVGERLAGGDPADVWSPELRQLCNSCDLVICNLECCISDRGSPTAIVAGKPFFFRGPPAAVHSLLGVGVGAVGLANNHALDYGKHALVDTLGRLGAAGIETAGAGMNEAEARRGAIVQAGRTRIGLVAISDHPSEFAAGPDATGIAYGLVSRGLPGWYERELGRLREECDEVIAFPHWGPNMNPRTARWQRRAAARMQAAGATLVAGHSAHVFHGLGWGEAGPLLFDLGDALDDYAVNRTLRNDRGVIALWRPGEAAVELVGLALGHCHTGIAAGEDADWIARRLDKACGALGTSVERVGEARFRVVPG
jgi:poly-gamma-glutamate capsule biosynthesis protein CapA/YwtB (metallophosphatase superfamily)